MDLLWISIALASIAFGVTDYAAIRILWLKELPMPFNLNPWAVALWGLLAFMATAPFVLASLWKRREQSDSVTNE